MQAAQKMKVLKALPTKRQKGVTLLEYAIMAALIAALAIAVVSVLGQKVNNTFVKINEKLSNQ